MRFNGPMTHDARRKYLREKRERWHSWFAWFPVRLYYTREFAWLEWVERQGSDGYEGGVVWMYRGREYAGKP